LQDCILEILQDNDEDKFNDENLMSLQHTATHRNTPQHTATHCRNHFLEISFQRATQNFTWIK